MTLDFSRNNLIFMTKCTVVGIILNIVLSYSVGNLKPIENEKTNFLIQTLNKIIMMFSHHKRVLFTSSLIVAVAVYLSVLFAPLLDPLFNQIEFLKV